MRAAKKSREEQLRMIAACQISGLTVAQWCFQEGIPTTTYYTWVSRLRKQGLLEEPVTIPQRIDREYREYAPEIVKVELPAPAMSRGECWAVKKPVLSSDERTSDLNAAVMEISIGVIAIKVTNQVDPQLLAATVRLLGGDPQC